MKPTHGLQIEKLADQFGTTPEDVLKDIQEEFDQRGHLQPGYLPFSWRQERLKYVVTIPESAGSWVDMEHEKTMDALSMGLARDLLPLTGGEEFDRGVLFSNDRDLTSLLAEWLRDVALDDGSELTGVRF